MTAENPYIPLFTTLQANLDAHHTRRENIIKASRDMTSNAKKIIFTLQRTGAPPTASTLNPLYGNIQTALLAVRKNMPHAIDVWRYRGQVSPGMQELVEALLFKVYLSEQGRVMGLEETSQAIKDILDKLDDESMDDGKDGEALVLTLEDYILGLLDFTGEVMKYCITTLAHNAHTDSSTSAAAEASVTNSLNTLRSIQAHISSLTVSDNSFAKEHHQKLKVLDSSVKKVENAMYSLAMQKAETRLFANQSGIPSS
jgi:predicted translin family RNA/ssDNA-binding protein